MLDSCVGITNFDAEFRLYTDEALYTEAADAYFEDCPEPFYGKIVYGNTAEANATGGESFLCHLLSR